MAVDVGRRPTRSVPHLRRPDRAGGWRSGPPLLALPYDLTNARGAGQPPHRAGEEESNMTQTEEGEAQIAAAQMLLIACHYDVDRAIAAVRVVASWHVRESRFRSDVKARVNHCACNCEREDEP